MIDPINYMAAMPNLERSFSELGQALGQRQQRRKASKVAAQYRQDVEKAFNNGKAEDFSALIAKYPQQRDAFKASWDILSKDQQDTEYREAADIYNAMQNNADIAKELVDERILAMQNSGEDTQELEQIRRLMDTNPDVVKNQLAFTLSSIDPDKWATMSTEMRERALAPEQLTAAQAQARKAAVDAKFAESQAVADLKRKGWDIVKIQEDIKIAKSNSKIAALEAQLKRETNQLKREELNLKLKEFKKERDEEVASKTAELKTATIGIDNSINTIDRLLKNPELNNVLGSLEGAAFYPSTLFAIFNPIADADKRVDATADIKNIQSQQFIDNLLSVKERGATFGSLTQKEGDKLKSYVRSLETRQSESQFINNLEEIQRLLLKSRKVLSEKHGVPQTIPDTPEVKTSPARLNTILQSFVPGYVPEGAP